MPISRRTALFGLGAAAGATALGWSTVGLAAAPTDRRLVVVVLRGGLDGLHALPAHGDPHYESARGRMALPSPSGAEGVIDLDGTFGLHPALSPLKPLWDAGQLGDPEALIGMREIVVSQGYTSGNLPVAHFGLGDVDLVDLRVTRADGTELVMTDVAANAHLRVGSDC